MPLVKPQFPFRSVTFRLTLICTLLISLLMIALYFLLSRQLTASLHERIDDAMKAEITEFEEKYREGIPALAEEFALEAKSEGIEQILVRLLDPEGKIITTSVSSEWDLSSLENQLYERQNPGTYIQTVNFGEHGINKARVISRVLANGNVLQIVQSMKDDEILLQAYRRIFALSILGMVIGTSSIIAFLMKKVMGGVTRITGTAVSIGEGNISKRVPVGNEGEEIERLAQAFNEMLSKIEALIYGLREVTDNIAHDLRSPLTRIRGIAETTLNTEQDVNSYKEMARNVIEESDRLMGMINTMLEISQADSGLLPLETKPVDMRSIIEDAYDLFLPAAEDARIRLEIEENKQSVIVMGDRPRLQRVLANLIDNAIKHTPAGGSVCLGAKQHNNGIEIAVADTGAGIPSIDLPRIWDRFYRGETSRSSPGNGLGLSFVQSVIRAHSGTLRVESTLGKGSIFFIHLPAAS
ncbi:MAG: hypothetical protein A2Z83_04660 [Omnitrophica bacterium GWA2_52_8]|nr:MAG: hypothetical protein A2Z83_04660 [Omnitrophica bacterium GWA2_52_8]